MINFDGKKVFLPFPSLPFPSLPFPSLPSRKKLPTLAETVITSHMHTKATFSVSAIHTVHFVICIEIHLNLFDPMSDLKLH